jgi:predicted house-cleaning noncanonical NTP pyrophosphatase (MazG superfamily)
LKKYHKAIRDKIPEIIQKDGFSCNVETMSDEKFLIEMEKKLSEEVAEYQNDKNPEELADILEVIYRIADLKGISKEQLEKIRLDKVEKRGAFEDNLFLKDTSKIGE